ncbi:flagellar hook-basal body complex protein [Duganella sp. FT3S]|uniref:Flagellar hook protein FlgE n=1 Tax=Rugamonas fusca TaxID=2758568 RepID=A0A7W2EEE7_9BURK|nr:flagellar hook-basal body complex protein [Rugamonas fusca]MBA5604423.1 flagellar hook-basal body complex protein [Rugamonas fusca]
MSFDIALSGIQAINEQLDTVSHNIANAGTFGFKSGRANFSALVAGSQPTGTEVGSVTQSIGLSGGVLNTGRSLDASINGRGFFVTKTAAGETQYTRVGIFDTSKTFEKTDAAGNKTQVSYLVDASGRNVQGFPQTPPSTVLGALGDITIPTGQIPAVVSGKMGYVGNLSADWVAPANAWVAPDPAAAPPVTADPLSFNLTKATIIYDSLGAQHTLTQYFVKTAPGVDVHFVLDGKEVGTPLSMTFSATTGQMTNPNPASVANGGTAGVYQLALPAPGAPGAPASGATLGTTVGATPNLLEINYTGTTSFAGEATTSSNYADGYASGVFAGIDLAQDGSVVAKYSNGQKQSVGKIAVAAFPDEGALTSISDTSWVASSASGTALVGTPGDGMAGSLNTSSLEQSNVDVTSELVGLMTSQRNYQANSKVIQTESTMMQSLMQAI